ncbi:MAG: phenylalanine--tRNA ligase subunit beta [Bdellovibrionales bacterium RIFOXYC2_FULL_39_8]|nr:MAG: phenylalanine--tRNA ligase subunit beta [Bdellovibrionales bacterium RIFOXYC2_FULL_39_8]
MIISLDWIKDFVKIPENLSAKEIGQKFTLATAEIEGITEVGAGLEEIKVAQILEIEKHPEADKLNLVTFKFEENAIKKVVCGASNVRVGMKVPYAPLGVRLPNGMVLEPKKIRGVLSEGMLCSKQELGLEEESHGLMELVADTTLGTSMLTYLQEMPDVLIEVDNKSLTHRPDLWGHFGIAREFATVFEQDLQNRFDKKWEERFTKMFTTDKSPIVPFVEINCSSLGYFGLSMNNVKGAPSPNWMQRRLKNIGLRPINNIVDVSNYVMLELGIPLHIFDRDKIKGEKLVIKQMNSDGVEFETLDEIKRKLIATDTVICDETGPLVLAGIMGGLSSGISDNTQNIFIEVANWKAADVRRTSARLGLRTDSSQRYEKSLDSQLLTRTMYRTVELMIELLPAAKVVGKLEYAGPAISNFSPLIIQTTVEKIATTLGHPVSKENMLNIFRRLDFKVVANGNNLAVEVPSYRSTKDVEVEADLIEEIGRIVGYDNIVPTSPLFRAVPVAYSNTQKFHQKIRNFLIHSSRAFEVMSYPMVGEKLLNRAAWPYDNALSIINPLSNDFCMMRNSLIPSILDTVALNQKNYTEFRFFELGRAYVKNAKEFRKEESHLGVAFFSQSNGQYLDLVNESERLLSSLNVPYQLAGKDKKFSSLVIPGGWMGAHPYEYYDLKIMGKNYGAIFSVHPILLREFKIRGNLAILILEMSAFENNNLKDKKKYEPLSKFPVVEFDCTVVMQSERSISSVLEPLSKLKLKELLSYKIVGQYDISEDKRSVTIRTIFGDKERTLSPEFIKSAEGQVISALSNAGLPLKE